METTKRKLFDKLKEYYNDKDFVIGVISSARTTENYQKIIDFMDADEDVTESNILALAVLLGNGLDPYPFWETPGPDF